MFSNTILKLFEAVFNGDAPSRIRRTQRTIIHRGYQLPNCRAEFVFSVIGTSPGTFFLTLRHYPVFV